MAAKLSLSKVQAVVGLVTGVMSIGGATFSALGFFTAADGSGEIVAVVRDAATDRPVAGATVEVLTRQNGLVTVVPESQEGVARKAVAPGAYRVRVAHPDYADASRDVQVLPEGVAEMHVKLERRGRGRKAVADARRSDQRRGDERAAPTPGQVVDRSVAVTRHVLGRIGF